MLLFRQILVFFLQLAFWHHLRVKRPPVPSPTLLWIPENDLGDCVLGLSESHSVHHTSTVLVARVNILLINFQFRV